MAYMQDLDFLAVVNKAVNHPINVRLLTVKQMS